MARRARKTSRRAPIVQGLVAGGVAVGLGVLAREIPGLMRELRIFRMAGFPAGPRRVR